jgi:hypothetical protein
MTTTHDQERAIIEAALKAATFQDAMAVVNKLKAIGVEDWRPVGDRYNNYGIIASSGSFEYKALEPVTNEQDALLERLAAGKWGDISKAPYTTPEEAANDLLSGLNYRQQADMVTVAFRESNPPTRSSKQLTVVYRDEGCGIEPRRIPSTIFAVGSSHKTERKWHQGAYGVGGASTYRNAKAVVLVTRCAPEMKPAEDRIAVAVVVWEALGKGQSAVYQVTTNFEKDPDAEPWSAPASAYPDFEFGTHLALISYGVEGFHRARAGDERSFDMVLNTRLFTPIMPVRFTNEITRDKNEYLRGLSARLANNPSPDRLEDAEELLYTHGGVSYKLPVRFCVFPAGEVSGTRRRFIAKNHALVFTSNGQVHHHWSPQEFKFRTKLEKLYDRVFVVVKTDNLPIELRTALFTPDRSQLLSNEAAIQLEDQVANFLATWHKLVDVNSQLIRDAISNASSGKSSIDVGRRISDALKIKGFNLTGLGGTGGGRPGGGGSRPRKKVETYPDPTALEGPDKMIIEDGKVRFVEYMLNATDDFLDSGRGALQFETDHPDIDVVKHTVVGRLRDGYVRVQLQVPEGAKEGDFTFTARLGEWHRAAGGLGPEMSYTTDLQIVDEMPTKTGPGNGAGKKGADSGGLVAVIWTTPAQQGSGWNNSVPGTVEDLAAKDIAAARDEYKELAKLGEQRIPTVLLNQEYAQYKSYIGARAKSLTATGTDEASARYAVGTGLGLLILHEDVKKREEKSGKAVDESELAAAREAVARSVLSMMPAFDSLAKEAGVES